MSRPELGDIYRRYAPLIHRRCLRLLGDPDDALDALHDIFLTVDAKIGTFRGDSELMTWIYRVATNHCLNRVRQRTTRLRLLAREAAVDPLPGASPDPIDVRRAIERLLATFSPRDVQMLIHRFGDEMTQLEIAEVLGVSERTVRDRLKKLEAAARSELEIFGKLWEPSR